MKFGSHRAAGPAKRGWGRPGAGPGHMPARSAPTRREGLTAWSGEPG